ncbi:hypothetical protein NNJEOMEG_01139 [Fundidesulfovibrio magnetotacticus]|uniref:DNA primase/polymerase bifunctional N-terminal domain-containing protein n=1 Tax=Fundidesulfovibrio magnetotacticus TaxID=2730080 RepID=A0A6V8LSL7_9BACT|nr:bifunctional DNA primase/polymerase [Fundidesulfovibrio magnetotacticus]GFK93308.1 hypothetical protein NNJEOMEG_01139 [Fundidesulfovibrio magnetotacticus]
MLATIPSSTVLDSLTALKQSASKAEAAQWYAENGIPVFPCGTDKRPRIKGEFHAATADVERVKAWWKKWPDASIGCPTGEGLDAFVLDVDQPDGPAALAELESRYGKLPATLEQRTGGGGRQLFFRMPAEGDVRNSAGKLGEGLDIRGNGGYVILPPSSHPSGGGYQWLEGQRPVEQAPEWLLNLLDPNRNGGKGVFLPQPLSLGGVSVYGNRALADECAKVAATPEGSRNDTLNQSAYALGQLVGGGEVDRQKAADALLDAALQAGLPPDEALRTLQSGLAAGERSPRQARQSHRAEELVKAAAGAGAPSSLEKEGSFIATLDLSRFEAGSLLATTPAPLTWVLNQSLLSGTVGFVCGAPGVGKSTFLLQLAAAVATGHPFFGDNLLPSGKGKVLALFAEEDERILVRRVKSLSCAALEEHSWDRMPESAKEDLEHNLILVPAAGEDLRFIDASGGSPRATKTYWIFSPSSR